MGMEENENHLSADQEYHNPDISAEYSQPDPESEFSSFRPATSSVNEPEKKSGKIRRLIRTAATAAVILGLAVTVEPEPEPREIESLIRLDCAVVSPEEPETLKFEYGFSGYGPTDYSDTKRHFYYVDVNHKEHELTIEPDPVLNRSAKTIIEDSRSVETIFYKMFYAGEEVPDDVDFSKGVDNNLSVRVYRAKIPVYEEGALLKIEIFFSVEGEQQKMVSLFPISLLAPESGESVDIQLLSADRESNYVHFRAVLNSEESSVGSYRFTDAPKDCSFCTRWYDAAHRFLNSGWVLAAPSLVSSYGEAWTSQLMPKIEGSDLVFEYTGEVHSKAQDPRAAYYSLELSMVDASTGWHYIFESEQIPIS